MLFSGTARSANTPCVQFKKVAAQPRPVAHSDVSLPTSESLNGKIALPTMAVSGLLSLKNAPSQPGAPNAHSEQKVDANWV